MPYETVFWLSSIKRIWVCIGPGTVDIPRRHYVFANRNLAMVQPYFKERLTVAIEISRAIWADQALVGRLEFL